MIFDDFRSVKHYIDNTILQYNKNQYNSIKLRDKTIDMIDILCYYLHCYANENIIVFDIGTGGGWIPILSSKYYYQYLSGGKIEWRGIDIDENALIDAKQNALQYNTSVNFVLGDLLNPLYSIDAGVENTVFITANLPYNTDEEREGYDNDIKKEPKHGIVGGGNDGLNIIRKFLDQCINYPGNIDFLLLQAGVKNADIVFDLCCEMKIKNLHFSIYPDRQGKKRFIVGCHKK